MRFRWAGVGLHKAMLPLCLKCESLANGYPTHHWAALSLG
jgi:hypothetical protein